MKMNEGFFWPALFLAICVLGYSIAPHCWRADATLTCLLNDR